VSSAFLTIAIPTFERLAYLREAVHSALAQDYDAYEILISDDGSSDAIRDFGTTQARSNGRLRYVHTPQRLGLSGNWNHCAAHARGTHLVIIGDDDRLRSDFLSMLAPHTQRHDVVFSDHVLIDSKGSEIAGSAELLRRYGRELLPAGPVQDVEAVAWRNAVAPSATLVRAELVRRLQFDPGLNTPELDFFTRAALEHSSFFFVPAKLAEYRVHADSATSGGLTGLALYRKLTSTPAFTPTGQVARRRQLVELGRGALVESVRSNDRRSRRRLLVDSNLWRSPRGALLALAALALPGLLRRALDRRLSGPR
jgi:glycosyltransferase involved in cell wall biosynthesis